MPRPVKFKRAVGKDAKTQPAIRVDCRGARQKMYLSMRVIAEEFFSMKQSTLAALVLEDFVKEHEANPTGARTKRVLQTAMELKFPTDLAGKRAKRPGGK